MNLDVMLPDVRSAASQAPDRLLLRALLHGAQSLCYDAHIWTEELDPIPIEAGVIRYDFSPPSGSRVEKILGLKYLDHELEVHARDRERFLLQETTGSPRGFSTDLNNQQFVIWPTPRLEDVGDFTVNVVLVPSESATTLPDGIVYAYRSGIIALAKAELLMLSPDMPWYDPQNALAQRGLGDEITARAKRTQLSGGHIQLRVRANPLA